jgi:hypothetical protein
LVGTFPEVEAQAPSARAAAIELRAAIRVLIRTTSSPICLTIMLLQFRLACRCERARIS